MELKTYKVYLNGVLLINPPNGLDTFLQEFIRDSNLFGIYSVSSFDLEFIGDGYCILKDFQENFDSCQMTIKIDRYCNNSWSTLYNGIIEVGSIEIDVELGVATCEMQDNSPLVKISQNSDITIDIETTVDIYGNAMPTPPISNDLILYSPDGVTSYSNIKYITWSGLLETVLRGITGLDVNVISSFFTTTSTNSQWTITWTGNMASIISTTVTYKDFQGNIKTVTSDKYTGNKHFENVRADLVVQIVTGFPPYPSSDIVNFFQAKIDYRDFTFTSQNNATKTITLNSNLPIEILDVEIVSADPSATVSFAQVSDYSDGGNNPIFMNYRMIAAQNSNYQFIISFKDLMEELNKNYNVYFIASYNTQGGIDFRIEDYQYFASTEPTIILDNINNLKISFSEDYVGSSISTGEPDFTTFANRAYTFGSDFCGLGDNFDAKSSFVIGTNKIWNDVQLVYSPDYDENFYIIENSGDRYQVEMHKKGYPLPIGPTIFTFTTEPYNIYLTHYHKIYRHLNRFKNNIIGVVQLAEQNSSININNIAKNRIFKKYEFSAVMSQAQFNLLIDNIADKMQFKQYTDTTYRTGLITALKYNNLTGKAEITTLGE
jgi:hypothetical protein